MIWVDGELAVHLYDFYYDPPFRGHSWTIDGNTHTVVLDRGIFPGSPGSARVDVSVWPSSDLSTGGYSTETVTLDGTPSPFVPPDVPSGQVLTTPTVRSCFYSHPQFIDEDDAAAAFQAAGVNAIEAQVFNSPADSGATTIGQWRTNSLAPCQAVCDWCVEKGFYLVANMDAIGRQAYQREWMQTGSFREEATRETAAALRDCGVCVGVETIDEVGNDPDAYGLGDFITWWRDEGGPPLAWPGQGNDQWETAELSGYSSRYYASSYWRHWRDATLSGDEYWHTFTKYTPTPVERPYGMLVSVTGPYYEKRAYGDDYLEGYDRLIDAGVRPELVILQVWLGVAYGVSRFRAYAYDSSLWRNDRRDGVPGVVRAGDQYQTGAKPGDDRWAALSVAYNSLADREAELTGTPYTPVKSGPWVFGRRGSLVFGVNTAERSLPSPNGTGTVISVDGEAEGDTVPALGVILWTL